MGGLLKPKKNRALERAQAEQASMLAKKENKAEAESAARRRAVQAAQAGRQRGLLSALTGSGITRKLGGGG